MFVVHDITDGKNTTRDYGHVNMFFRECPLFRSVKDAEIFKECVEQGFIYISEYYVEGLGKWITTYQKTLKSLLDEVAYNRTVTKIEDIK